MLFRRFFCEPLAQAAYLIADGDEALVVDPRRDIDELLAFIAANKLRVRWVAATHVHADFIAGLGEVAAATGARVGIGERFAGKAPWEPLADGQHLTIGGQRCRILATPGHTPESICFLVQNPTGGEPDRLLSGDTLFVGDVGRPDLAQNEKVSARSMAEQLFASLHERIAPLPDATEVWPAHGAGSACGSAIGGAPSTTLGESRRDNWALRESDPGRFCDRLLGSLRPPPRHFAAVARQNAEGPPLLAALRQPSQLRVDDVHRAVAAGAVVLDIRPWTVHGRGHWPSAINIGLDGGEFEPWAGDLLPADAAIIVHAENPERAHTAVRRLRRIGHEVAGFVCELPDTVGTLPQVEAIDLFEPGGAPRWQVVDVRTCREFAEGHVPAAQHAELAPDMAARLPDALDRSKATALVCEGGYRSSAAAALLCAAGFTDVHNVRDGMRGWRSNHLPLATGDAATATS